MSIPKGWIVLGVAVSVAWPGAAIADLAVYDDVWDVSQGASVTSDSGTKNSAANMFGAAIGIEAGNTLWSDTHPAGFVHWVEWQTPNDVTIRRFNLVASHEAPYTRRSCDHFALFAWSSGGWVQIYDQDVPIPYGGGPNYTGITLLELNEPVDNVVAAQKFRAEFTQHGNVPAAKGPRIIELDGSLVPEPMSLGLLAVGALGVVRCRRRAA